MSEGAESIAPAPGTGDGEAQTPPAAEPKTTDTSGPPETIPYGRFKEVNDALRPYKELEEFGYSPDDLRQLAEWDAAFQNDPAGTWLEIAKQLDMPDEVKEAIMRHQEASTTDSAPVTPPGEKPKEGEQEEEKPPAWAQEILDWKRETDKADEDAAFDEMLTGVVSWWKEEDKKQGISTPDEQMLSLIIAHSAKGGYDTIEKLQDAARKDRLSLREADLKPITELPRSPTPVPGDGAISPNVPAAPKTLSEASALARVALEKSLKEE